MHSLNSLWPAPFMQIIKHQVEENDMKNLNLTKLTEKGKKALKQLKQTAQVKMDEIKNRKYQR